MSEFQHEWEERTLRSVLQKVVIPVHVQPEEEYREIGIRSHGKGIFHKPVISGASLGTKRVFQVVPDALVLNIVFAWEQAVATTTKNESGMIASHRFPMYQSLNDQCDVKFLHYFFCTKKGKDLLEIASPGGAGRNKTLGQEAFEKLRIPMPGYFEQQRIATILNTWDNAITTTERLIENSKSQKRALMQRLLPKSKSRCSLPTGWEIVHLGELVTVNPGKALRPPDGRVSFLPMEAVTEDGQVRRLLERSYESVSTGYTAFIDGDVLVAKITPCFENGKGALVNGLLNGIGFGSTEFHVLRVKSTVSANLVAHIVNSHEFRTRGASEMTGSAGQKRVPADYIRSFNIAIPTKAQEQGRIVSMLDAAERARQIFTIQLEILHQQKSALMQQLLKGKRRVQIDQPARAAA